MLNFYAALGAAPPRMKARIAPCLRQSTLPLRSVLNKRSTFHFGRCWTRATGTQQHWRLAPRNPAPRYVYVPLRSALNAWSTLRSGRCWTSGLRSTSVVAGRVVYTPFRSLLDKRHWRLATQARSAGLYVSPTAQLALIPSCRQMSAHPAKRACPSVRPLAELS